MTAPAIPTAPVQEAPARLHRLKDIIFWSTIAFSLSGLESASMMGDEIRDPRRNIPRALMLGGVLITLLYILSPPADGCRSSPESTALSPRASAGCIPNTARLT